MKHAMEIKTPDPEEIRKDGTQEWIPFNKGIPGWSDSKGDWGGRYLCIVERPNKPNTFGAVEGGICRTVELCYFNDLSNRFQDKDSEWVKVTHWTQISKLPSHNVVYIPRGEMLRRIKVGELKEVFHGKVTDELYEMHRDVAFCNISYDETLYCSSIRENGNPEDCMYTTKLVK